MGNQAEGMNIKTYKQMKQLVNSQSASDRPPFTKPELVYLRKMFIEANEKNILEMQTKDLQDIMILKQFVFFSRLQQIFEQEKGSSKNLSFQKFLQIMKVFHINTPDEQKYQFLFRIMDWDQDNKLGEQDLRRCLWLIYKSTVVVNQAIIKELSEDLIAKNDDKEIDFKRFKTFINRSQLLILMTMKFQSRS